MPSYTISPVWGAGAQLFDNNGDPLAGGKIYVYRAGTTTPATTYIDPLGSNTNTNPIIANSSGRLVNEVWLDNSISYKFVLKTANETLIGTYDNIPAAPQPPVVNDAGSLLYEQGYQVNAGAFTVGATYLITAIGTTDFTAIGAAANVTGIHFIATGPGAGTGTAKFSRYISARLQDTVTVKDFGAVGNGVADDTVAIQAALNSGAGAVYIPSGTYRVSTLSARANTLIYGNGNSSVLAATGTGNILVITGVSGGTQITNVQVRNIKFQGLNNMAAGPLGCGVIVLHAQNIMVDSCYFDSFGPGPTDASSGGAALCFYVNCVDVTASNNTVVNGTGYLNGTDIAVYSAGGYAIIDGNRVYSTNSNGIYTNAATKTGRIIITNNISQNHTRHGITPVYAGTTEKIDTIIANNICQNCDSTGIYINTDADGVVITNNIVESCSGGGPNGYTLDGGISMLGDGLKICTNNYIANSGYTTAGAQRSINTPGVPNNPTRVTAIRLSNGCQSIVTGNIINGSAGRGIDIVNESNGNLIANNAIYACELASIFISAINNGGLNTIDNNILTQTPFDGYGIWHRGSSVVDECYITNNIIRGSKAGTNKSGIRFESAGITGRVTNNRIETFDVGLNIQSTLMAARLGDTCIFDGNNIADCTVGFTFLSDLTDFGFYTNFVFVNNGTNVVDEYLRNTVLPAVSVAPYKVFYRSTFPTVGTWAVNDRVIRVPAAAGQPKAWVCTVAGTPGTWTSEGNL